MATEPMEDPWRGSSGKRKAQQSASAEREAVFRKERESSQTALLEKMAKLKALRIARDSVLQGGAASPDAQTAGNVAGGVSKPQEKRRSAD